MAMDIKVCMGTNCIMTGNLNLYEELEELANDHPGKINLESVKCLNACKQGKDSNIPVISIDGEIKLSNRTEQIISEILEVISE